MLARKQFGKSLNAIRKKMRFSFFSIFDQIKIINYFKFADQSNSTSIKSIKFNIFINCFNSTSRVCFSINQNARISHIALDKTLSSTLCRSFKFFKFVVFINSFNSTLHFSLSVNHNSIMSQMLISISSRIHFFRVLINQQMIYVSIIRFSVAFKQRYFVSSMSSYRHLNIRVETTLKEKRKIMWRTCIE